MNLGDRVKDRLSDLQGIVVGRSEYLFSSPQLQVQPDHMHQGKPVDALWMDESRFELVAEKQFRAGFQPGTADL